MLEAVLECRMIAARLGNGTPGVELFVRPVVPSLQFFCREPVGLVDDMPRVIEIPVTRRDTPRCFHFAKKRRAGVRCENVERCRGDAIVDCPIDRTTKWFARF